MSQQIEMPSKKALQDTAQSFYDNVQITDRNVVYESMIAAAEMGQTYVVIDYVIDEQFQEDLKNKTVIIPETDPETGELIYEIEIGPQFEIGEDIVTGELLFLVDENGDKIPVYEKDEEGNFITDEEGNKIQKEGEVPQVDENGFIMVDDEGNIIPAKKQDDAGNYIYKTKEIEESYEVKTGKIDYGNEAFDYYITVIDWDDNYYWKQDENEYLQRIAGTEPTPDEEDGLQ